MLTIIVVVISIIVLSSTAAGQQQEGEEWDGEVIPWWFYYVPVVCCFVEIAGISILLYVTYWVYNDALLRGANEWFWALITLFTLGIGAIIWFFARPKFQYERRYRSPARKRKKKDPEPTLSNEFIHTLLEPSASPGQSPPPAFPQDPHQPQEQTHVPQQERPQYPQSNTTQSPYNYNIQQNPTHQYPQQSSQQPQMASQGIPSLPTQPLPTHANWSCPQCGNDVEAKFVFCTNCGYKR